MINESVIKSQNRLYVKAWAHCSVLEEVESFFSNKEGVLLEDEAIQLDVDNFLSMIFSKSRSHEEHVELVDYCNQCFFDSEIYKGQLVFIEKKTVDSWKRKLTLQSPGNFKHTSDKKNPSITEMKERKAERALNSFSVTNNHNTLSRALSDVPLSPMKKIKIGRDSDVKKHSEFVLSEYYQARLEERKHAPCELCSVIYDYKEDLAEGCQDGKISYDVYAHHCLDENVGMRMLMSDIARHNNNTLRCPDDGFFTLPAYCLESTEYASKMKEEQPCSIAGFPIKVITYEELERNQSQPMKQGPSDRETLLSTSSFLSSSSSSSSSSWPLFAVKSNDAKPAKDNHIEKIFGGIKNAMKTGEEESLSCQICMQAMNIQKKVGGHHALFDTLSTLMNAISEFNFEPDEWADLSILYRSLTQRDVNYDTLNNSVVDWLIAMGFDDDLFALDVNFFNAV